MKSKVIAFRVTQDEYDALMLRLNWCKQSESANHIKTTSDLVNMLLHAEMKGLLAGLEKERKRQEAKAKREAKKAAADG